MHKQGSMKQKESWQYRNSKYEYIILSCKLQAFSWKKHRGKSEEHIDEYEATYSRLRNEMGKMPVLKDSNHQTGLLGLTSS